MSTETDRKAQDLYRFDGSDPDTILALRSAFRAGAEFAAEHTAPSAVPEAVTRGLAQSAAREEAAGALEREFGCFLAHDPQDRDRFWGGAADALLARFNITPKETDR